MHIPNLTIVVAGVDTDALHLRGGVGYSFAAQQKHQRVTGSDSSEIDSGQVALPWPHAVKQFREQVITLACGESHVLLGTNQGSVYGAGSNTRGQLGISLSKLQFSAEFLPIDLTCANAERRRPEMGMTVQELQLQVHSGCRTSFAIFPDTGCIYAWGDNQFGATGVNSVEDVVDNPRLVWPMAQSREESRQKNAKETPKGATEEEAAKILDFSAGPFHAVALLGRSEVVCWGCNVHGQLAIADAPFVRKPSKESELNIVAGLLRQLRTGTWQTIALTLSGQMFVCGTPPDIHIIWDNLQGTEERKAEARRASDSTEDGVALVLPFEGFEGDVEKVYVGSLVAAALLAPEATAFEGVISKLSLIQPSSETPATLPIIGSSGLFHLDQTKYTTGSTDQPNAERKLRTLAIWSPSPPGCTPRSLKMLSVEDGARISVAEDTIAIQHTSEKSWSTWRYLGGKWIQGLETPPG